MEHMRALFTSVMSQLTLLVTALSAPTLMSCSEPQCVPGRSVECACVGGGRGAQTCAPSGQNYLQCICTETTPLRSTQLRASPSTGLSSSNERSAQELDQVDSSPSPEGRPELTRGLRADQASATLVKSLKGAQAPESREEEGAQGETLELAPIKISRSSVTLEASSRGAKLWWLVNERQQSCALSDDINAPTHPARLLAQGCYTKLSAHGKMRIKCDASPMGPKTYLFAESQARCREIIEPPARQLPSDFQSRRADSKVTRAQSGSGRARAATSAPQKDTWYCMCYQEVFQGEPSDSTACRKTKESCLDLEQKVAEGSPILVKGSTSARCKRFSAQEPWDLFGVRYQWLHSSQPGSWWTPRGCFMQPQGQGRRASRAKRRRAHSNARQPSRAATRAATPKPPAVVTQEIESESRCAEACSAQLKKPGAVPSKYAWAASFARSVRLIIDTCEARKKQQKRGSYRKECLQGGVKACTKMCERAQ